MSKSSLASAEKIRELRRKGIVPWSEVSGRCMAVFAVFSVLAAGTFTVVRWVEAELRAPTHSAIDSLERGAFLAAKMSVILGGALIVSILISSLMQTRMYISGRQFRYATARRWQSPRLLAKLVVGAVAAGMVWASVRVFIGKLWSTLLVSDTEWTAGFSASVRSWCMYMVMTSGVMWCVVVVAGRFWFRRIHRDKPRPKAP